ncbi:MAG TPA: TMEM165/GDT1 family protein [Sporichthya sp.]|nr:TMEM165/GDT1 family protein [Sporichthya sp.]
MGNEAVVAAATFVVIFFAELPDKSMFASIAMGARMPPRFVWLGTSTAFGVHVLLAVAAGSAFARLPDTPVKLVTAALFALGAVWLLRGTGEAVDENEFDRTQKFVPAYSIGFVTVFIGEWGDLTQIMTANLAAAHGAVPTAIGSFLALISVSGLGMLAGRSISQRVPMEWFRRVAAAAMLALAVWSLVEAFR